MQVLFINSKSAKPQVYQQLINHVNQQNHVYRNLLNPHLGHWSSGSMTECTVKWPKIWALSTCRPTGLVPQHLQTYRSGPSAPTDL